MKNDPIAPTIQIELDKKRTLVFDMNTFAAFEEATGGQSFFEVVTRLMTTINSFPEVTDESGNKTRKIDPVALFKVIPVREIRALVWAALHTYDAQDDPHWPLTINQVGRLIHLGNVAQIALATMTGQLRTNPTAEELEAAGEEQEATEVVETEHPVLVPPIGTVGGQTFGQ